VFHSRRFLALSIGVGCLVSGAAAVRAQGQEAGSQADSQQSQGRLDAMIEQTQTMQSDLDKLKRIKLSGYVQARYDLSETSVDNYSWTASTSSAKTSNNNRFYIRRARVKVTYDSSPLSQGVVYLDGGQDRIIRLLEAYVTLKDPWTNEHLHQLMVGQFNVPFGYEIERSSSVRELPERSRAENVLFPGERDRGATFTSQWTPQFQTALGILNGGGVNNPYFPNTDPTNAKDFVARARYAQGKIDGAVSYYNGRNAIPLTAGSFETDKTRLGADAQYYYALPVVGGGTLRGEFYSGHEMNPDSLKALAPGQTLAAGAERGHLATDFVGWYAMWVQNAGDRLQLAARYDTYDPNTDVEHDQYDRVSLGIDFFYDGNTRFTVSYDIPMTDVKEKAPADGYRDPKDNLWTLQLQHKF
jgi:hypothetical protein